MDDTGTEIGEMAWMKLEEASDDRSQDSDDEENGETYKDILTRLQIRPESQEEFFDMNILPWRNKHLKELRRGGATNIRKLSKLFLTAMGQLTWLNKREWLLTAEELEEGEEPLYYKLPRERKEGDHDRFFAILDNLWERMRSRIFETQPPTPVDFTDADSIAFTNPTNTRQHHRGKVGVPGFQPNDTQLRIPPVKPPRFRKRGRSWNKERQNTRKRRVQQPSSKEKNARPGVMTAGQTEEAILNIIVDLHETRANSHPGIFARLFQQHLARLEEIEYIDELGPGVVGASSTAPKGEEPNHTRANPAGEPQDNIVSDSSEDEAMSDTSFHTADDDDRKEAWLYPAERNSMLAGHEKLSSRARGNKNISKPQPTNPARKPLPDSSRHTQPQPSSQAVPQLQAQVHVHQPKEIQTSQPLHLPLTSPQTLLTPPTTTQSYLINPTLPEMLTTYITPFSYSSGSPQPYIWLDAPVVAGSYEAFRAGVCLRANVPEGVGRDKVGMVLAYGWNDLCRLVRGEGDWREFVMADLRQAARRGVTVWRVRVCCVVLDSRR
ncbi:hypothetical protein LTR64_000308 [Lithohypha guttulata]|uniref:uncharacterized protein n=1 Tax=Lithohypha guttulata TaxID=1690604 RepID=UPI002DDFC47A|nr:hypothetical protein LTR51_007668 [Lithohypha guttulata]